MYKIDSTSLQSSNMGNKVTLHFLFFIVFVSLTLNVSQLRSQAEYGEDIMTSNLKSRYSIPVLSKEQMYEDFDYLYYIFEIANPQIEVRKNVTGTDILMELSKLRSEIDTISSTGNFIMLLYRALRQSMDLHCQFGTEVVYWKNYHYKKDAGRFDEESFALTLKYEEIVYKSIEAFLNLKYINGVYFNIIPINIYYKRDSISVPPGAEIISLNNISLKCYIEQFKDIQSDIRWDFDNKCYYANSIKKYRDFQLTSIQFKFMNDTVSVDSIYFYTQENTISFNMYRKGKCVEYLEQDSVLYIRCPLMNKRDIKFYRKQIRKHKHSPIIKTIIDIRGNPGGNDDVWISILKNIIKNPIKTQIILVSKDLQKDKKLFPGRERLFSNKKVVSLPWDSNTKFNIISKRYEVIRPSPFSIRYNGNVYVIQDEDIYSSAGSLSAMAIYIDNIVNVGKGNGKLGGRGLMPVPFILPNTKLIFLMNFTLDITGAKLPEDVYGCKVEIPVILSPQYYLYRNKYLEDNPCSKSYLYNMDDIFIKIMNLNH